MTYHPRTTKHTESGLYTKYSTQVFTQRLTIHNTKTIRIENLKVLDNIPLSANTDITVKLTQPSLPSPPTSGSTKSTISSLAPVKVSEGVTAMWDGIDDPDCDVENVGKDGKINWICTVPAQGKVNLALGWEVTCPSKHRITGL